MTVRPFQIGDLRSILRIEGASFDQEAWTEDIFVDCFRDERTLFLIAAIEGRTAGYIIARFGRHGAEIDSLAVLPRYRRQGVAIQLLKTAMQRVRRAGVEAVWLTVQSKNLSAISLYRKFGFVRTRTIPGYYANNSSGWRMRNHPRPKPSRFPLPVRKRTSPAPRSTS